MNHVLIIEDDQLIATLIQDVLEDEGVTSVHVADDETSAVTAGLACLPRLIIADVMLKSGTGPSAVARIRERAGPVPVIFITGNEANTVALVSPGTVLAKPFTCHQLLTAYHDLADPGISRLSPNTSGVL
jgi:DNA-binding response OmpR family regulator